MKVYIVLDIGCIECGESSAIVAIVDKEPTAKEICRNIEAWQEVNWSGEHSFYVEEIEIEMKDLYYLNKDYYNKGLILKTVGTDLKGVTNNDKA